MKRAYSSITIFLQNHPSQNGIQNDNLELKLGAIDKLMTLTRQIHRYKKHQAEEA